MLETSGGIPEAVAYMHLNHRLVLPLVIIHCKISCNFPHVLFIKEKRNCLKGTRCFGSVELVFKKRL